MNRGSCGCKAERIRPNLGDCKHTRNIEDPRRAIEQLRNLAKGHALSMGKRYITLEGIPVVIHSALSTASMERVRIFELLIQHEGVLTAEYVCDSCTI